ncbi:MAG: sn-glycerol-3-phosphate ABC transporter ATP-binding protein UgpC [Clostridiales bacterium]|jgi:multiple sugar transport system ATP-binding protein|nr:sn-glycerol-3-phosphate ABC transporter ATP-binding protein UgpC [Clostridiales bacterium]
MATVGLKNLNKAYPNGAKAVGDFSLEIADGEFIVLVGPSGCGKSTTLRMVAGLEGVSSGKVFIDGKDVTSAAPKDRDIAMVFQNYALYPQMTVYRNMAFGLTLKREDPEAVHEKVMRAAEILGLLHQLNKTPAQLSGGQRQRVAVGRAIVRNPKVFLFDEPLSNLDAKLRGQMRHEIKLLHKMLKATMIYVTHDQVEAMTLADRIVVMNNGIVQQVGAPMELYKRPANLFVAGFIGLPPMNFFDAALTENGAVKTEFFEIELSAADAELLRGSAGREIVLGIRPEDAELGAQTDFTVDIRENLGQTTLLHGRIGEGKKAVFKLAGWREYKPGDRLKIDFKPEKLHFFDKATEKSCR